MLNPLGPCDPPLYPYRNTLPAPHHTSPHPCGCLYGHNQRNSCSYRGGVEWWGGRHCRFLNELTIWTVRAKGMSAASTQSSMQMHARAHKTDTHAERLGCGARYVPVCQNVQHTRTCAPESQTILVLVA